MTADSDRKGGGDDGRANGAAERKRSRSRSRDRQRQDRSKDRRRWARQCVHCSSGDSSHAQAALAYAQHMPHSHSMEQRQRRPPHVLPACFVLTGLATGSARVAGTGEGVGCWYVEHCVFWDVVVSSSSSQQGMCPHAWLCIE